MPVDIQSDLEIDLATVTLVREAARRALAHLGFAEHELSLTLCKDDEIKAMNATWRGIDETTDVLSFPLHEPDEAPGYALGDVVINVEYAARSAADSGHGQRVGLDDWTVEAELVFLLIHGLLHLLGYDHDDSVQEAQMIARERQVFAVVFKI